MFKYEKTNTGNASRNELSKYIDGNDLFNSTFLYKVDELPKLEVKIDKNAKRVDLISETLYGSPDFSYLLIFINRMPPSQFALGATIKYISKANLENLIKGL